ncbi:PrgI family protein [Fusobacterium naviforme]|nr:PrgI family protein [Fusobacterium naviforme]
MAIEVDVPVEIDDYKEKLIFNMSLRQLGCFSAAVVLGVGSYFLCTKTMGLSMDATSYVIIAEALPLMALGFIQKDGQPFEKFFALMIRHRIGLHKLTLEAETDIEKELNTSEERKSSYAWIFEKESTGNGKPILTRAERKENRRIREAIVFQTNKAAAKRKGKATRQKIKAAQKEYRAAKRKADQEHEAASGTKERRGLYRIFKDVRRRYLRGGAGTVLNNHEDHGYQLSDGKKG